MSEQPSGTTAPAQVVTPSWKLLVTLGIAGAASGFLIIAVFTLSAPRIEAYKSHEIRSAIDEVLEAPARSDTLYLVDGALSTKAPAQAAGAESKVERVFVGYDKDGKKLGYALQATGPGFSDPITLLIGYDRGQHTLTGMKILDSKETPGIADGILKPAFTGQFHGAKAPVNGVKAGATPTPAGSVVLITGATISSRAVLRAINTTLERWDPILARFESSGGKP